MCLELLTFDPQLFSTYFRPCKVWWRNFSSRKLFLTTPCCPLCQVYKITPS